MRVHRLFRVFIIRKQKSFFIPSIQTNSNTDKKRCQALRRLVWQKTLYIITLPAFLHHHHILS